MQHWKRIAASVDALGEQFETDVIHTVMKLVKRAQKAPCPWTRALLNIPISLLPFEVMSAQNITASKYGYGDLMLHPENWVKLKSCIKFVIQATLKQPSYDKDDVFGNCRLKPNKSPR